MRKSVLTLGILLAFGILLGLVFSHITGSDTKQATAASPQADKAQNNLGQSGNIIGGPGTFIGSCNTPGGGAGSRVYDSDFDAFNCITVTNIGSQFITATSDCGCQGDIDPGDTRTYCCETEDWSLRCTPNPPPACPGTGGTPCPPGCEGYWVVTHVVQVPII